MSKIEMVRRIEDKLSRLKRDRDRVLRNVEEQIEGAERLGLRNEAIEAIRANRDKRKEVYRKFIEQAEERLANARDDSYRAEEEHQRQLKQKAKEKQLKAKRRARLDWLESGGDPDEFENAWPEMWTKHLMLKAQPKVGNDVSGLSL